MWLYRESNEFVESVNVSKDHSELIGRAIHPCRLVSFGPSELFAAILPEAYVLLGLLVPMLVGAGMPVVLQKDRDGLFGREGPACNGTLCFPTSRHFLGFHVSVLGRG